MAWTNGYILEDRRGLILRFSAVARLPIAFLLFWSLSSPLSLSAKDDLAYTVSMVGVSDPELQKLLEAVSETMSLRESPPVSLGLLRRRVQKDIPLLIKALRSQGYYGARITPKINTEIRPLEVVFHVDTGAPYPLESVNIHVTGDEAVQTIAAPGPSDLGLILKKPARSKPILEAGTAIADWYRKRGFPHPEVGEPKAVVDHKKGAVSVSFQVYPGIRAPFGRTEFSGLESVDEAHVRSKLPWKEGQSFDGGLLKLLEERLIKTGLFSSASARVGGVVDKEGHIPVEVHVRERKHRTVKGGATYKTDEGPGGNLSWEHRNIRGRGDQLKFSGLASRIGLALEGRFRRPDFFRPDQALLLSLRLAEDKPDAFRSTNITGIAQIDRKLTRGMDLAGGVALRLSKIEQIGREDRFDLVSLPFQFQWDTSDQLLDPTRGGRLVLQAAPFYDFISKDLMFYQGLARYSRYIRIAKSPSLVLALRGAMGIMSGAARDDIPADIRFYAGGGGSVRGYAYQSVGPILGSEPLGGRSMATVSVEMRARISEKTGLVAFVDGGSAFESEYPDFNETLRWGGGLGFRYFTGIGPLRLDVGLPLNPRPDLDERFQIYVSIGQAF